MNLELIIEQLSTKYGTLVLEYRPRERSWPKPWRAAVNLIDHYGNTPREALESIEPETYGPNTSGIECGWRD